MNRTQIFSGLEDRYQKYRPAYPSQILDSLHAFVETGRNASWPDHPSLIDVGAGTGILTRQLRDAFGAGFRYLAVEPGDSMRRRAEAETASNLQIEYVDATAEAVPAEADSAALVIAAQAVHWFDRPRFYEEAARILVEGGTLALLYNYRDWRRDALLAAYEDFLESNLRSYVRPWRESKGDGAGDGELGSRSGLFDRELQALDEFHGSTSASVEWQRTMSADEFIELCLSTVQFQRASGGADEAFRVELLRKMIASHYENEAQILVPYLTTLRTVRRKADHAPL